MKWEPLLRIREKQFPAIIPRKVTEICHFPIFLPIHVQPPSVTCRHLGPRTPAADPNSWCPASHPGWRGVERLQPVGDMSWKFMENPRKIGDKWEQPHDFSETSEDLDDENVDWGILS